MGGWLDLGPVHDDCIVVEIHGSRAASLKDYHLDLQKILFFRCRLCGESGGHQGSRNRFV